MEASGTEPIERPRDHSTTCVMRPLTFATATISFGLFGLVACHHDAPTQSVEPRIVAERGNAQTGYIDTRLPVDFVVRVSGPDGEGVPNVSIDWRVTSGAGELVAVGLPMTVTDASGRAAVSLRPTALGAITVTASTPALPGALATFTAFATKAPDVVIRILPGFDCGDPSTFVGPDGTNDVIVRVGAVVEWVYSVSGNGTCSAQLRSTTVPPGGASIDAFLGPQDRFQFVASVAGTWTVADVSNGGGGTVTAEAP